MEAGVQAVLVGVRAVTASGQRRSPASPSRTSATAHRPAQGAELEITTNLRAALFTPGKYTRADRATNAPPLF